MAIGPILINHLHQYGYYFFETQRAEEEIKIKCSLDSIDLLFFIGRIFSQVGNRKEEPNERCAVHNISCDENLSSSTTKSYSINSGSLDRIFSESIQNRFLFHFQSNAFQLKKAVRCVRQISSTCQRPVF